MIIKQGDSIWILSWRIPLHIRCWICKVVEHCRTPIIYHLEMNLPSQSSLLDWSLISGFSDVYGSKLRLCLKGFRRELSILTKGILLVKRILVRKKMKYIKLYDIKCKTNSNICKLFFQFWKRRIGSVVFSQTLKPTSNSTYCLSSDLNPSS